MNYSRGVQPSCCSKSEYEEQYRKHWRSVKETPPSNGQCVVVLFKNDDADPDFWTRDIAYYCNDGFYKLEYDPVLDIMRKVYVNEPVEYWANYYTYSTDELK